MSNRSILPILASVLLWSSSAALQQPGQDFPDGPGKDKVVAVAAAVTTSTGSSAGYTPDGWNTLQRMMQNMGAPFAPEDGRPSPTI